MKFKLNKFTRHISDEAILKDLRQVAKQTGKRTVTKREYSSFGKFNTTTIRRRFGSWNAALRKAGLKLTYNRGLMKLELFVNLKKVWRKVGRQPRRKDMDSDISEFNWRTYTYYFGSLRQALVEFIEYANRERKYKLPKPFIEPRDKRKRNRTNRTAGYTLRYKVLQRDAYKCVKCGSSPAYGNGTRLHIDHIKPYSKGGETVLSNLQTLCEACNLGKGDK